MAKILTRLKQQFSDKKTWLALVAGLVLTFAYAPFGAWPLAFFSIAVLCYCSYQAPVKQAAWYGFIFAIGWFAAGISWVHVSIAQFGGMPLPASIAIMALLVVYLALYPALALALTAFIHKHSGAWLAPLLISFAFSEWLRGTLLTGFPWLSLGYTQTDSPVNILAPVVGEFGLSVLVLAVGYGLYRLFCAKVWQPLVATLAAGALVAALATVFSYNQYSGKQLDVALVQGNIKQSMRWQPENFWPTMLKYQDMTRLHWDADLVVWPEAAIPELEQLAGEYLTSLDKAAVFNDTALITGIVDYQYDTRNVYNTLVVVGKKQRDSSAGQYRYLHKNRYRKHQLLPIGEFVPFEDLLRPLAPLFDLPMSSFSRGERVQDNLIANGYHILAAICYEIAFPDLVRDNYRSDSDILFTVSNDAWFGDSHGPHQHMQISRMRALELQRPLVRVTNTGVTGVYDPISQSQLSLAQFDADVLRADVRLISGDSLYAQYGRWPTWLALLCLLGLSLYYSRRVKKSA
ncbi:apolipoprotein N-acyltransferase [Pseudoalteromonas sp. CnMc7-15]|uniref:apolipoprotein N-acyltransferase n=1 Tax=unclassified Pseudoalteromonas TaxID=194690 RepID=UPI001EF5AA25|nr:apolipoprotein N-acyltransferase [Pseudoalteromonas sp. CnMc7-15]MCG7567533.1 apolipoprotein N-acyltransferase [Pseudoalteromonas sp. CnMc7-15]